MTTLFLRFLILASLISMALSQRIEVIKRDVPKDCNEKRISRVGDKIIVHYDATIDETSATGRPGTRYDSSYSRKKPSIFIVGQDNIIPGLQQALQRMCPGERRSVRIPPELGFGHQGAMPHVPPGATVRYDIHCLKVTDPTRRELLMDGNVWRDIDLDDDWIATKDDMFAYWAASGSTGEPNQRFLSEDTNQDGVISWEEFTGPKGNRGPPGWNGDEIMLNPAYHDTKHLVAEL